MALCCPSIILKLDLVSFSLKAGYWFSIKLLIGTFRIFLVSDWISSSMNIYEPMIWFSASIRGKKLTFLGFNLIISSAMYIFLPRMFALAVFMSLDHLMLTSSIFKTLSKSNVYITW